MSRAMLYVGDALAVLRTLPDESVQCCITSPAYWGLRDYGTGTWEGGDESCDHKTETKHQQQGATSARAGRANVDSQRNENFRDVCGKCGATRIDQQLGLEASPEEYVAKMVEVFGEVKRVLRDDGTLWLNLGDSYAGSWSGNSMRPEGSQREGGPGFQPLDDRVPARSGFVPSGLKPKDLVGIPWAVAKALQQPHYTGRISDERDRIWLAATVEAEGCLFIHRRKAGTDSGAKYTKRDGGHVSYMRKQDTYGSGLEVASTDRVVVERCMAIAGIGSICEQAPGQNPRRKQTIYRWNVRSNECRWVVGELYPYFIAKQHEARLLIGCPSSGDDATKAHESLKAIHQGRVPTIDFPPPQSLFETGWYLRADIIWAKKNCMPESVRDRPTRSHEYVFLLSKSARYFYDADAIAEPLTTDPAERYPERARITGRGTQDAAAVRGNDRDKSGGFPPRKRSGNKERKSEPYRRSQVGSSIPWFADDQLMRRPQYRRAVQLAQEAGLTDAHIEAVRATGIADAGKSLVTTTGAGRNTEEIKRLAAEAKKALGGYYREFLLSPNRNARSVWTIATRPYPGAHFATFPTELAERCIKAGSRPGDTVLDPFGGSGTTAAVATGRGRNAIHIDLNPKYLNLAIDRIGPLLCDVQEVVA